MRQLGTLMSTNSARFDKREKRAGDTGYVNAQILVVCAGKDTVWLDEADVNTGAEWVEFGYANCPS